MEVTIFKEITDTETPYYTNHELLFDRIKDSKYKNEIIEIRKQKEKSERDRLKKKYLPAICWSGKFRTRKDQEIIEHSGLICLDFDGFKDDEEFTAYRDTLESNDFTYSLFTSPSGNGFKVLFKIPPLVEKHRSYFKAIQNYFDDEHFDVTCVNESRACFESYDPNIYINKDCKIWQEEYIEEGFDATIREADVKITDVNRIIDNTVKWFDANYSMHEGERNHNLYKLVMAFNEYGVPISRAELHCSQYAQSGFSISEINKIIKSAYSNDTIHGVKYYEDYKVINEVTSRLSKGENRKQLEKDLINEHGKDSTKKILKKAETRVPVGTFWEYDKKGNVKIIPFKFKRFLEEHGFKKFYLEESKKPTFIKIDNRKVEISSVSEVKDYTLKYLREKEAYEVWDYIAQRTSYFKEDFLHMLDSVNLKIKRDTSDHCFLFYRNCIVKISKDKITTESYIDSEGLIWKNQIIDRDFNLCKNYKVGNMFYGLVKDVSDANNFERNEALTKLKRVRALETSLGYLIHNYKNPSEQLSVIFNDEEVSDNPEGGSGKSLMIKALQRFRSTVTIDGKTFDPQSQFAYQRVNLDTQILAIDDLKQNFNFELLFSVITEGMPVNKKNKDEFYIPFTRSPKLLLTTNYVINGTGNSHERRRHELEFHKEFDKYYTPREKYGKDFFTGWNQSDWDMFENYMISCIQKFLRNGLVKPPAINTELKRFISATTVDFVEFAKENLTMLDHRYRRSDLIEKFMTENPSYKKLSHKKFSSWMKYWASYNNWDYSDKKDQQGRYTEYTVKGTQSNPNEEEELPF